ncbi:MULTISPECIES: N-acetylglucosamine kinase [Kosmotoga]|uniref:ATPase BadF/BadG/BcrA/BcrD type n=1 Tax=Kosmotoga olearia (strain ATCC BAA-1733 / DSM 21960 / TBF 19.5.1) TaxID=521045 RepID=C5CFI5_KOSOT|nr:MULTISPECIES: BadF/BadG/BcrA/BcrD ATPase family protein [Kosmotoga]ACR79403.1 ATPase BadF/BadG/BcrA/BcrD type [Kosmotoga olearia TBF 19.5.1]OAA22640.1 hypothetical protein DU53_03785 [Kosmotoga sp. DU53]
MKSYDFFLGVDGGGTKTFAVVYSGTGECLGTGRADSADVLNRPRKKVIENLRDAVDRALEAAGITREQLTFSCFGMPVFGDIPEFDPEIKQLVEKIIPERVKVVNDVRLALEGAHPLGAGVILLAGTGAMLMAKNRQGEVFKIDGWGEHAGDMGSGYYIGKRALQTVFKMYDGRISKRTPLFEMIKEYARVSDLREILLYCKGDNSRTYIASLSKVVCEASKAGDEVATAILDEALRELLITLNTVKQKIREIPIPVAVAGGIFNCEYIYKRFRDYVDKTEDFYIKTSTLPPHVGAIILAAKEVYSEERLFEFLRNIKASE